MKQSATAIFRHADVELLWRDCWNVSTPCDEFKPLSRSNQTAIRLRVVERLDRGDIHTLGWVAYGSSAATIQYRRAREIAQASTFGLTPGVVLGHVAAHEIGHILLGSNTHDLFGVMKATYGSQDLLSMVQGRLLFTAEELQGIRSRACYRKGDPREAAFTKIAMETLRH